MIESMWIELKTIDMVNKFVNDLMQIDGPFELILDRRVVNAKSTMSIFTLDLSEYLELRWNRGVEGVHILEKYRVKDKSNVE